MKVMHIIPHVGSGGDWTIVRGLMAVFSSNGHSTVLAGANVSGKVEEAIELNLNRGLKGWITSAIKARRLPRDVDIIHAHSLSTAIFGVYIKSLSRSRPKLIYTFHWAITPGRAKRHIVSIFLPYIDIVHVYSKDARRFILNEYCISPEKVRLAYIGVDQRRFLGGTNYREKIRRELNISDSTIILLYVGRLAPEKGLPHLLAFLHNTDRTNIMAMLVGSGDQEEQLQRLASEWNLENKVHFVPHVENVEEFYRASDLLVLPSVSLETFGLVVVEAALSGLPTVRSNLPGASDQIVDGESGFIYGPPESMALAEKLEDIFDGQYDLPLIGERACEHALRNFTYEKMYQNVLGLYRGI